MTLAAAKPGLSPEAMNNQYKGGLPWLASNWDGACDGLAKIDKPLLAHNRNRR